MPTSSPELDRAGTDARGERQPSASLRGASGALVAVLRGSPGTLPALAALALMVAWATDEGGYPVTHWAPGAIVLLGLVWVATVALGWRVLELPRAVLVALGCLAVYTAWSYISIAWAAAPGDALEGADRTLLYLVVFLLFVGWRIRGAGAALLVAAWVLAMAGVALYVLIDLGGTGGSALAHALPEGRLVFPADYVNADAAQWMMAAWPALLLARGPRLHPVLRGLFAGAAVLLSDVALLSLSRGAVLASAIVLVLVFVLLPGRRRTFAALVPIGAGIAASVHWVLAVGDQLKEGFPSPSALAATQSALRHATFAVVLAAAAVAVCVALAAAFERSGRLAGHRRTHARRLIGVAAWVALVGVLAGGLAAAGNPISRVSHEWNTFTSPQGYEANSKSGNRLVAGLGSNRYDFYRVALDEYAAHPLLGIGAENFAIPYLRHGRSGETPRYPHSVELRTLTETGTIGGVLALVGLAAALLAAMRATRSADALSAAVAAAALAGFGYWAVHGSADWFWEYAGLGAPAFALLGIACALDPTPGWRARDASRARGLPRRVPRRLAGLALAGVASAGALVALGSPWLARVEIQRAAAIWSAAPSGAYSRLSTASRLDPLSPEAEVLAGSIALRRLELARADSYFRKALQREPEDEYAVLERGAIASSRGRQASAAALLRRALVLYPRDGIAREALEEVEAGRRVDVAVVNGEILRQAARLR